MTVREVSDREFFAAAFGHAPRTKAERLAEWQAKIEEAADMIERDGEWAVSPPLLHDAKLLVAGRKRARKAA